MEAANEIVRTYRELRGDYLLHLDPFDEDDDEMRRIKYVITHRIDEADRVIILLYAELGSLRKLGARLGVSSATAHKEVKRIQATIKAEIVKAALAEEIARL